MTLSYYYRFERVTDKSRTRVDCTHGQGYAPFDMMRAAKPARETEHRAAIDAGALIAYITDIPKSFGGDVRSKAKKNLTMKGENISSLYQPNANVGILFGDVKGTPDAMIIDCRGFSTINGAIAIGSYIDVYIGLNLAYSTTALYNAFCDGSLDGEIALLKGTKETKNETPKEGLKHDSL